MGDAVRNEKPQVDSRRLTGDAGNVNGFPVEPLSDDPRLAAIPPASADQTDARGLTQLETYPNNLRGHLGFVEWVCKEICAQAHHVRNRTYPDSSFPPAIAGIWRHEALDRVRLMKSGLPEAAGSVESVLVRELTMFTVERVAELLKPAVIALRDAYWQRQESGSMLGTDQQGQASPMGNDAPSHAYVADEVPARVDATPVEAVRNAKPQTDTWRLTGDTGDAGELQAEQLATIGVVSPSSFVALYHWCKSQIGWGRAVNVAGFHCAFQCQLRRREANHEADAFPQAEPGDGYADSIIHRALDECLRLAILSGELPPKWTESRTGAASVQVPANPLWAESDFLNWFGGILDNLSQPGTERYEAPATALMLWDDYRRAKSWLSQHAYPVSQMDPVEDANATKWFNGRQSEKDRPATRSAHEALAGLLAVVSNSPPADPPSGAKPVDESDLSKYQDPLTPLEKRILAALWKRNFAVQFNTLREEAWESSEVSDSGVERRLQDIEKRWVEAGLNDIDLEIYVATTSVKLVKPTSKTGDKKGDN